ncbi:Uncharacterised protein [Serratia proteamaculans]|uniref:hypothetical protein n=1 Tax=Serratia proteamaculans TaxID=28151 RepID=UPI0021793E5E|nr:hypothetical protein [Serratia proteamaculans]CAI1628882.1 Uncharacterised protein [Serratia proteamaculans]
MFNDYLSHTVNTLFFMYQEPFNHDWDTRLIQLLDEGKVISASRHCVTFSLHGMSYDVWVSNRWYSYGYLYEMDGKYVPKYLQYRPRFHTMRRLNQLHGKMLLGECSPRNDDVNAGWMQKIKPGNAE